MLIFVRSKKHHHIPKSSNSQNFWVIILKNIVKIGLRKKLNAQKIHRIDVQSMTSNCHTFFLKKCDDFGTFIQKILFLDYNKTKKAKSVTI